jgi:prepilin-type processing-associated H-X9-DG protein
MFADKRLSGNTWCATGGASPSYNGTSQPYQYGAWVSVGWLYYGGFMKSPKIWWDPDACPNVSFSRRLTSFSVPGVTICWPPGNWGTTTYPAWCNQSTSIGYKTRPSVSWSNWDPTTATLPKASVPKFRQLKSAALMAESMYVTKYEQLPHARGMNVLFADGSAQWVNGTAFMKDMVQGQSAPNTYILSGSYPTATGVWGDFDKRP